MDFYDPNRDRIEPIRHSPWKADRQPPQGPVPHGGFSWVDAASLAAKIFVFLIVVGWLGLSAWGYWGPPGKAREARLAKEAAEREAAAPFSVVATDGPVTILRDKETGCEWIVATTTLREHRMTYRVDNLRPRSEVGPDGQVQQLCRPKSVQSPPATD